MPQPHDYTSNSKKSKDPTAAKPEKKVEKVVVGEVIVQKKGLGRRFKDLFVAADFGSVVRYIGSDVILPAARNLIVESSIKGVERMVYGDNPTNRRYIHGPSRMTYNSPINRQYRDPINVSSRPVPVRPTSRRSGYDDVIVSSRDEAEMVLERMNDIIDTYEVASLADLKELLGLPNSHVDQKWGWVYLGDTQIRQVREGYLIDVPPAEPIQ